MIKNYYGISQWKSSLCGDRKKMKKKNGRKAASDLNEVNFVNFPLLKQGRHKNQFYHTFI